jgi:hypothetical protein
VLWLVLWAIDVKSFDAFLLTIAIVLIAASIKIVSPLLPGRREGDEPGGSWTPR